MAEPAEFSTADLDHLEDALEGLELAPPTGDVARHVGDRLGEYRNILMLSRAAMPMVDVPRGLLDDVIAQARATAEVPAVVPGPPPAERPGFWARLRRFGMLPGIALAGTAAAVMFMVERKPDAESAAVAGEAAEQDARARAAPAGQAVTPAEPAPAAAPAADAWADGDAAVEDEPAAIQAARRAEQSSDRAAAVSAAPSPKSAPAPMTPGAAPAAEPIAEPIGEKNAETRGKGELSPSDAGTPRWDIIARGDRARHRGECGAAKNEYSLALGDVDARVRARAHAGLGLCEAQAGNRSAADSAYEVARELDGEIAGFIEDERPRGGGVSAAKAKPKASKAKSDVLPTQQAE